MFQQYLHQRGLKKKTVFPTKIIVCIHAQVGSQYEFSEV